MAEDPVRKDADATSAEVPVEPDAPRLGAVSLVIAALAVLVVGSVFGLSALERYLTRHARRDHAPPSPMLDERPPTPEPRLQVSPPADMRALRAEEQAILEGWAVIDSAAGRYRIPIERAMDVIAERGLPVREETPDEDD